MDTPHLSTEATMRLRWKFNLASAALLFATVGVVSVTGLWREQALFEREMHHDHEVMGASVRSAVRDEWIHGGPNAAAALVRRLDAGTLGVSVRLVSPTDPSLPRPVVSPGPAGQIAIATVGGSRYTLIPLGEGDAAIELCEAIGGETAYLRGSGIRMVALFTVLALFTAMLQAALIDRWVVGPIDRMIAHARRIAGGDLRSQVGPMARDELGKLGDELDRMAETMERAARRVTEEERARQRAVGQLRHAERLASIGQLAAGIAHELGTPLNVVLARGQRIERWEVDNVEDARSSGRIVAEQAKRMAAIVRQLLDFARPRGLVRGPCAIGDLARRAVGMLDATARHAGVKVVVDGDTTAEVDEQQLEQVVVNLVRNAIDASERGDTVFVRISGDERAVRIAVEDHGKGIEARDQRRLFEPFFTTKEVGQGTGLGLSVSWGIVREHGGRIDVASEPGRGSVFQVLLPLDSAGGDVGFDMTLDGPAA